MNKKEIMLLFKWATNNFWECTGTTNFLSIKELETFKNIVKKLKPKDNNYLLSEINKQIKLEKGKTKLSF